MRGLCRQFVTVGAVLAVLGGANAALAQKAGGTMKVYHRDTPPSASIHEEATTSTNMPFMAIYNNLVIFDQHVPTNSLDSIVPELATEWSWSDDKTAITFKLHDGVKWHDGKPFTAEDVKCTWDMLKGTREGRENRFRKNPRESWYWNLDNVTTNGPSEVTFHLKAPQPSFLALLASGYSPVYPCHVPTSTMRTNPIGTGPFKFVSMQQNENIKLVRNENYWKKDLPYLDAIEFTIIKSRSTRTLAFIAKEFDLTFVADITAAIAKDINSQAPDAICERLPTGVSRNLIVNRESPPFDNPKIREAMALTIDRDEFIQILSQGHDQKGGAMLPAPGVWAMPDEQLAKLPGYGENVEASREKARAIMKEAGYGPENPLKIKVSTRNIEIYRDPAVILIDHLKKIYIDAELEVIETSNWHAKVARKDYQVGMNLTGVGVDDPDVNFFENYACGSERNYTGYCNEDLQKLFIKQSGMTDTEARKKLVWEIDSKLQEDGARPIIFHANETTCYWPDVKNLTLMNNSSYNGWRFEDVWLDR